MKNYYEILGVSKTADENEIRRAYRMLSQRYNPAWNSGDEKAAGIYADAKEAFAVLTDAEKRAAYDEAFGKEESPTVKTVGTDGKNDLYKEPTLFKKSGSFKAWLDNFWYHHKFGTIAGLFVIIFAGIMIGQFITRPKYDYYMIYAGPRVYTAAGLDVIKNSFGKVIDEENPAVISLNDLVMLSPDEQEAAKDKGASFNPEFLHQTMQDFYQQMMAGDAEICLLSPYLYGSVYENGVFVPLDEIFGNEIPDSAYDDCGILLSEIPFGQKMPGVTDLPEDTILCVRKLAAMKGLNASASRQHEKNIEFFRKIVTYEPPVEAESNP